MMKKRVFALILFFALLISLVPTAFAATPDAQTISPNKAVTDNLASSLDKNYYLLTLSEPGSLQIEFQFVAGGDYYVYLYQTDHDGSLSELQRTNFYYSGTTESGTVTRHGEKMRLPAGSYYVMVCPYSGSGYRNSDYVLKALYQAEPGFTYEKEFNNNGSNAMPIALNTEITGNLSNSLDADYYTVTLSDPGSLQIEFRFVTGGDYYVYLYQTDHDGSLSELQRTNFYYSGTTESGTVTRHGEKMRLPAGSYYVKVCLYSGSSYRNSDYVLKAVYQAEPGSGYEKEFNNSASSATTIYTNTSVIGNLSSSLDKDYFKVTFPVSALLQVQFQFVPGGDYYVVVYDVDSDGSLRQIQKNNIYYSGSTESETVMRYADALNLPAGSYYVRVYPYSDSGYRNGDYVLTIGSDVNTGPSSWAIDEVDDAIDEGLVPEEMQADFTGDITRGEFCTLALTMLCTAENATVSDLLSARGLRVDYTAFTDTNDYNILAAYALGIINGRGKGVFDPYGSITRQEAAAMLTRTAKVLGVTKGNASPVTFADRNEFAAWAAESIAFVSSMQDPSTGRRVMSGTGNDNFSPKRHYTREQSFLTVIRLFHAIQ